MQLLKEAQLSSFDLKHCIRRIIKIISSAVLTPFMFLQLSLLLSSIHFIDKGVQQPLSAG